MTIILRATKGSALTWTELDGNFTDLDGRLTTFESGAGNPIDSITVVGNQMTITYSTTVGGGSDVVTIPVGSWRFTGPWQAGRDYVAFDVFSFGARLFIVLIDHTSASTFDPGRQIGGFDVYQCLLAATGETTTVALAADTYTIAANDSMSYFRCSASDTGGVTVITIPDSSVDVPVDAEISFRQCADNILSFEATSGVILNVPDNRAALTDHIGAVVTLKKVDTDEWDIFGALAVTSA